MIRKFEVFFNLLIYIWQFYIFQVMFRFRLLFMGCRSTKSQSILKYVTYWCRKEYFALSYHNDSDFA